MFTLTKIKIQNQDSLKTNKNQLEFPFDSNGGIYPDTSHHKQLFFALDPLDLYKVRSDSDPCYNLICTQKEYDYFSHRKEKIKLYQTKSREQEELRNNSDYSQHKIEVPLPNHNNCNIC